MASLWQNGQRLEVTWPDVFIGYTAKQAPHVIRANIRHLCWCSRRQSRRCHTRCEYAGYSSQLSGKSFQELCRLLDRVTLSHRVDRKCVHVKRLKPKVGGTRGTLITERNYSHHDNDGC